MEHDSPPSLAVFLCVPCKILANVSPSPIKAIIKMLEDELLHVIMCSYEVQKAPQGLIRLHHSLYCRTRPSKALERLVGGQAEGPRSRHGSGALNPSGRVGAQGPSPPGHVNCSWVSRPSYWPLPTCTSIHSLEFPNFS